MIQPRLLSPNEFAQRIRLGPLVSIDLIVRGPDERILTGLRLNEPAKGTYFVPGGVILKNEKADYRITRHRPPAASARYSMFSSHVSEYLT
jgi:colanic acid biosynthesis protein WcaH